MVKALDLAEQAGIAGDVPVGAIVKDGKVIAHGYNKVVSTNDPTAHAEVLALRQAGLALKNWHLTDCTLYVTLEPCAMCAGAIGLARIKTLVYGADDLKAGAVRSVWNIPDSPLSNHRLQVIGGFLEGSCRSQLQDWFAKRRQ